MLLCGAFRKSLLDNGLKQTTTASVLAATGLSKGAMYHHFRSKNEIVEAVYRAESHGAIRRAVAKVPESLSATTRLKLACTSWLKEMEQPEVAHIVLNIGPTALGLGRVIEIENELSLKLFEQILEQANAAGEISLPKPKLAVRLINAMIGEVALQKRDDRAAASEAIGPVIDAILESLAA
ncbi:TetR/AcrR family transcriptional regulator [Pontixanthobacter sp. CEM42]|uniref:TetR/AcrR family transcriptional regulator n=1 Tax=Pontixanthobacter sp. CEM42 TaxID=2792077 RepID=UPI002474437C|nr:TetR/AcrR family transcriptional regulator [Pontixanthobacter sp. CEM42]